MREFKVEKYVNNGSRFDVNVDYDNKEIWLNKKQLCSLYDSSLSIINKALKNAVEHMPVSANLAHSEQVLKIPGSDGKIYNVKHYNMNIILNVGYKCNPSKAVEFKEWVDTLFKENTIDNKWLSRANNYEIVKFESDVISIDVNVSPNEDTVWLNQSDMAFLFDTTIPNISMHINDVFDKKELDINSVIKKSLTTAKDGKTYNVTYYNLDMVLSIGYRINSKRGIEFRRWANKVLKNYLLKGYSINTKRCLQHSDLLVGITNEIDRLKDNVNMVIDKVEEHDNILTKIVSKEVLVDGMLVYEGNIYKAYSFIRDLFLKCKNRLIIIDGYVDKSVLDMLDDINVDITIYTYPSAGIKKIDIDKFNINHKLNIIKTNIIHSRFIIVDDTIYQISESIKDVGVKRFVSTLINFISVDELLKGL